MRTGINIMCSLRLTERHTKERYVTLPLMRNVDEAVPATLPDFERRIGQRIWESVEAGKTKEVDVSGLSWTKIAGEVLKVLSLTS